LQVEPNLAFLNLGVIDVNKGALLDKMLDKCDGSRFTGVTSIRFERKAKDGDTLYTCNQ
jgi:hypothetical protein